MHSCVLKYHEQLLQYLHLHQQFFLILLGILDQINLDLMHQQHIQQMLIIQ